MFLTKVFLTRKVEREKSGNAAEGGGKEEREEAGDNLQKEKKMEIAKSQQIMSCSSVFSISNRSAKFGRGQSAATLRVHLFSQQVIQTAVFCV